MIYNSSILAGQYIEKLKISKTIPIFKKRSKTSNYRPISLLSNLNKIVEKFIFNRLYEFFETFDSLYNLQFVLVSIRQLVLDITEILEMLWIVKTLFVFRFCKRPLTRLIMGYY